ncbi:hypothetical protein EYF80_043394 [Liparis tanakae]|uniref:Uncharacterized protein n=1 Tax=Liparis tanakae TaxID=230148 RepID=A0A4Z2FZX3_9TELE|nr:hypothetical protein EYF80_043394 [Liparis tanakae]
MSKGMCSQKSRFVVEVSALRLAAPSLRLCHPFAFVLPSLDAAGSVFSFTAYAASFVSLLISHESSVLASPPFLHSGNRSRLCASSTTGVEPLLQISASLYLVPTSVSYYFSCKFFSFSGPENDKMRACPLSFKGAALEEDGAAVSK